MFRNTYLKQRFFFFGACIVLVFIASFSYSILFAYGKILIIFLLLLVIIDISYLIRAKSRIKASRSVVDKLSMGDVQFIAYEIDNSNNFKINVQLIDELPYQFQHREELTYLTLNPNSQEIYNHIIRPTKRGIYSFGSLLTYISNPLIGLVELRVVQDQELEIAVVPSIIQMKKYQLQVFSQTAILSGIRKVRRVGENDEFEHIRSYTQGDHIKSINWKATSRKNQLMVNQYQNSRSQRVYTIIDKGRSMKMPFKDMTLLDHTINAALVISNIILKKYDKAGLITFSDKIGSIIKAESRSNQLELLSDHLYKQKTGFKESNFELLFYTLRKVIQHRSILLFYTNFEHYIDLERNLPYLLSLNRKHLLVVIIFINTELEDASEMDVSVKSDIYFKTFAQKSLIDKEAIALTLRKHNIQTILTPPDRLSIHVINKYLEIKAKRMK